MTSNSSRAVQLAVYCRKDTMRGGTTNFYANGTLRNEQIVLHPNDLNAYATVLRAGRIKTGDKCVRLRSNGMVTKRSLKPIC